VYRRSSISRRAGTRSRGHHGRGRAGYRSTNIAGLLPQPPDDREKYSYIERHVWVLTCCSLVSFSCLAVSQFRLAQSTVWLWLYLPFLLFTILYYLVSLSVGGVPLMVEKHPGAGSRWRMLRGWRDGLLDYPLLES
jgi:cellulose synthase (UDP-forming)